MTLSAPSYAPGPDPPGPPRVEAPSGPDPRTSAEALESCLRTIEASEGFPAFSRQIKDLMSVLGNEDASVQHLAQIVLKDYSLTLKVIRAANSFHYNRSGRPVLSATHAMVLLGVQAVRNIVSSLLVFEHFQRAAGVQQLMLLSLLTANHAREAADHTGLPRTEEAYLCGMFRNLGEVLVATHMPEPYAAVLATLRAQGSAASERLACLRVLGFEYEALGEAMARRWNLPPEVVRAMDTSAPPRDTLEQVVAFGHALTGVIYRKDADAARPGAALVLQKFGTVLRLTPDDLRAILDTAVGETKETFRSMNVALNDLRLRRQIELALGRDPARAPAESPAAAQGATSDTVLASRLADEVDRELRAPSGADLNRVLLMAIEAVQRGGTYDRVVFALVTGDKKGIAGRLGLGTDVDALIERFNCALGVTGGPIGTALSRRQELVLSEAWELRPDEAEVLRAAGARSCVVLPVQVRDVLVGCLYADQQQVASVPDDRAMAITRRLRDAMGKAMTVCR